jgi:hypothetical protein
VLRGAFTVQVQRRVVDDVLLLAFEQVAVVAGDDFQVRHAADACASGGVVKPPQMVGALEF